MPASVEMTRIWPAVMAPRAVASMARARPDCAGAGVCGDCGDSEAARAEPGMAGVLPAVRLMLEMSNRKSTRLNSSHSQISYAVFCLKKKKKKTKKCYALIIMTRV